MNLKPQPSRIPLWAGVLAFFAAQVLVAVGMTTRGDRAMGPYPRAKTIALMSGITLGAAVTAYILAQFASRKAARRPALAVAGGLAASLLRLTVPLSVLAWLQLEEPANGLPPSQRQFMAETIVVSYLVLLFVDILLNCLSRPYEISEKFGKRGG